MACATWVQVRTTESLRPVRVQVVQALPNGTRFAKSGSTFFPVSFKPKSQEEFEEEFKRRVMTGYSSGSTEGREKYLDEWMIELQKKALEGDSRLEARERVKMGEEDSSSRRRTEWERIFDRSQFLKTAS